MAINTIMQELVEMGLYSAKDYDQETNSTLLSYIYGNDMNRLAVDLYCPYCKEHSTFNPSSEEQLRRHLEGRGADFLFREGLFKFIVLHFRCAREMGHYLCVQLKIENSKIIKIGQYPSIVNIDGPQFNKYNKILPDDKIKELKKAVGLFSHGIGIGSFVYLRRVFEYLIEEAFEQAKSEGKIDEGSFMRERMGEKIDSLKDYLPKILTSNKIWYSIVSAGIHSMSEEECNKNFKVLEKTITRR
ncbi:hypothetical protein AGMMS49942_18760 [Spirochaetia bacterium]|nr:hypothetical protein AGMMS49942_18760 [Spirochaetia bacterium]